MARAAILNPSDPDPTPSRSGERGFGVETMTSFPHIDSAASLVLDDYAGSLNTEALRTRAEALGLIKYVNGREFQITAKGQRLALLERLLAPNLSPQAANDLLDHLRTLASHDPTSGEPARENR